MPYFDPASAPADEEIYLEIAADVVQKLSPAPTPETLEYQDKAARAEFLILKYLRSTQGGTLTGKSLSGLGSRSFASSAEVRSIVRGVMGDFYTGSGATTLTVASTFPSGANGTGVI